MATAPHPVSGHHCKVWHHSLDTCKWQPGWHWRPPRVRQESQFVDMRVSPSRQCPGGPGSSGVSQIVPVTRQTSPWRGHPRRHHPGRGRTCHGCWLAPSHVSLDFSPKALWISEKCHVPPIAMAANCGWMSAQVSWFPRVEKERLIELTQGHTWLMVNAGVQGEHRASEAPGVAGKTLEISWY